MRMRSRLNLAYRGVRARTHDGKRIRAKVQAVSTLSAILALVVSGSAWLADQRLNLDVNDPRPLAAALEQLEKRHGWVITYDDPPYLYARHRGCDARRTQGRRYHAASARASRRTIQIRVFGAG
jgi:hypothetical protein